MASMTRFIEERLKLKVNRDKSAVAPVEERKFLGYQITARGVLRVSQQSLAKLKERIRELTRRNRGVDFATILADLKNYLTAWMTYYRLDESHWPFKRLDSWIRRKVRCCRLKQTKGGCGLIKFLTKQCVHAHRARQLASSGRGWWRLSKSPQASIALSNDWLTGAGLISLETRYRALNLTKKPPDTLSMSGGVGGR
jgi:RNA-directed DNA polymerase